MTAWPHWPRRACAVPNASCGSKSCGFFTKTAAIFDRERFPLVPDYMPTLATVFFGYLNYIWITASIEVRYTMLLVTSKRVPS
eukprot:SAG11_NODE_10977_length_793_cov_1.038961_1_plen_82_part_10